MNSTSVIEKVVKRIVDDTVLYCEMFVINVIDDFLYSCLLEIHYFVIKYLGITQFQVTRL